MVEGKRAKEALVPVDCLVDFWRWETGKEAQGTMKRSEGVFSSGKHAARWPNLTQPTGKAW